MKKLSSEDRSRLIKLASSLPKGDPEKRAILAGLRKVGRDYFDGGAPGATYEVTVVAGPRKKTTTMTGPQLLEWGAELSERVGDVSEYKLRLTHDAARKGRNPPLFEERDPWLFVRPASKRALEKRIQKVEKLLGLPYPFSTNAGQVSAVGSDGSRVLMEYLDRYPIYIKRARSAGLAQKKTAIFWDLEEEGDGGFGTEITLRRPVRTPYGEEISGDVSLWFDDKTFVLESHDTDLSWYMVEPYLPYHEGEELRSFVEQSFGRIIEDLERGRMSRDWQPNS